jgi:hypothetical protein
VVVPALDPDIPRREAKRLRVAAPDEDAAAGSGSGSGRAVDTNVDARAR